MAIKMCIWILPTTCQHIFLKRSSQCVSGEGRRKLEGGKMGCVGTCSYMVLRIGKSQ